MRIAIHQPNFMPYYPFFQKIRESDKFVILSNCQYEKNGYQNRFNHNGKWHTMSTNSGIEPIQNKKYLNRIEDWNRIKTNIKEFNLSIFDKCISESLWLTNTDIIHKSCKLMKIDTSIYFDYKTELRGTERLVDICKHFGADEYLSGISGRKYLDLTLFEIEGIRVTFQDESKMIKKSLIEML